MIIEQAGGPALRAGLSWRNWPLVGISLLTLGQVVASLWIRRGYLLTVNTDIIQFSIILFTVVVFLRNAALHTWPGKLFWQLVASGWGLRLVAQTAWIIYELALRQEVPNPFVGDVLLFMSDIPVLAALLLQTQIEPAGWLRRQRLFDFVLLLLWWLYLYLYFVIPWQYVDLNEGVYSQAYNRLGAAQDSIVLLILAYLVHRFSGQGRAFFSLLLGARLLMAVVGSVVNLSIDRHVYYPGSVYDVLWTAALAAFPIVGLCARALKISYRAIDVIENQLPMERIGKAVHLSLPVITAYSVLMYTPPQSIAQFRQLLVLATIVIMAFIMFARHAEMTAELSSLAKVLHDASMTDPLTGARNRRFFEASVPLDASYSERLHSQGGDVKDADLIFYLIDLDDFKEVNDQYGHMAGDKVLEEVARAIRSVIRSSDILIRWGGDEFLVVSRHSNRGEAAALAVRILGSVASVSRRVGTHVGDRQTCSIGWAVFPWCRERPTEIAWEGVLGLADRAVYRAKATGRNRAVGLLPSNSGGTLVTATAGGRLYSYSAGIVVVLGPGPTERDSSDVDTGLPEVNHNESSADIHIAAP
jgi:diguanylate cyclase (GGDEF)-like protein